MPNCNANSAASSRRSSRVSCNGYSVFSGRDSAASSRRSSGPTSRQGSRRGSLLVNTFNPVMENRNNCSSWPDPADVNTMHDSLASLRLKCDNSRPNGSGSPLSSPSTPPISSQQQPTSSSGPNNLLHTIGSGVVGSSSNRYYTSATFSRTRHRHVLGPSFKRPNYRDRYFL